MHHGHADIHDHVLLDAEGRRLGPIRHLWLDPGSGRPLFASVRAGILPREHVVPLQHARIDGERREVHLPYASSLVRGAPVFPADRALTHEDEMRILGHYRGAPGTGLGEAEVPEDIVLHRDAIDVDKRVVQAGGVRLRKVVRTKIVHQPVEVRYEEVVLERVPPGEAPVGGGVVGRMPETPFEEGALFIPEFREEPVISRHAEVAGGVRARREVDARHETISTPARREDVEVERLGAEELDRDPARDLPGPGR